jgi:hypothetical protein
MNIKAQEPPRQFKVGISGITLSHCADIELKADELVTFVTESGNEYDVTRKSWGFYATPSFESRLFSNHFQVGLVKSEVTGNQFVVVVETERIDDWAEYSSRERLDVIWMCEP